MDATALTPTLIGAGGIIVGAIIGVLGSRSVERYSHTHQDRRDAYLEWLRFGYRMPILIEEGAEAMGVDHATERAINGWLADMRALMILSGSKRVRHLITDNWGDVMDEFTRERERLTHSEQDAFERVRRAHSCTIESFLGDVAEVMDMELHRGVIPRLFHRL